MLPVAARLRAAADFAATVRRGRRGSSPTLVVHLLRTAAPSGARAGFVVSKKVGNAVIRHRITRRLRPLVRARLADLPAGADLVVRALPAAAGAASHQLARDLDRALVAALPGPTAATAHDTGRVRRPAPEVGTAGAADVVTVATTPSDSIGGEHR